MRVGIFSTFIEPAALELVRTVQDAVTTGEIQNTEISFIFSNRELGESKVTDDILDTLTHREIPLVSFSARKFKPEMRIQARKEWRNQFGEEVLKRLPQTDIDLLLGDMYIWGDNLCTKRNGINLHPALPNGPKGEWYKVIWQLIKDGAKETGVMMHKVTPDLDRGPTVTYCRFSIHGYQLDGLWSGLPKDEKELTQIINQGLLEKENTSHPLHKKIREHGLTREFPLTIQTVKSFAEGRIRIQKDAILDSSDNPLLDGFDLTRQIDEIVQPTLEGITSRREVRI